MVAVVCPPRRWAALFALAVLITCALGCGDDARSPDAGSTGAYVLEILDPPGDTIGLPPQSSVTLRVRYRDDQGHPLAGAAVTFALVPGAAGTGGASLGSTTVATDDDGVAGADLLLGSETLDFQVAADAGNAPRATFYVLVSSAGFSALTVTPSHRGFRADTELAGYELRLYRGGVVSCATFDPAAPPTPSLPPRSVAAAGVPATWQSINALAPYLVVAWGVHAVSGLPVALGCVDLGAAVLPPGPVRLGIDVVDRAPALTSIALASTFDLSPVAAVLTERDVDRPWLTLACPRGPGQLALDAIAAGLDGAIATAVTARRGVLGDDGCRGDLDGQGRPGLDAAIAASIAAGGFPSGDALDPVLAARAAAFHRVDLVSQLDPAGAGLRHRLEAARLPIGDDDVVIDLRGSARPVIAALAGAGVVDGALVIGDHAMTLRVGSLIGAGLEQAVFAPRGLSGRALGSALVGAAAVDGQVGCAAIDAVTCAAADAAPGCLAAACPAAAMILDDALAAWWREADGVGLDLELRGLAAIGDPDGDLVVDAQAVHGSWSARLQLRTGAPVEATGSFAPLADEPAPPP